MDLTLQDWVKIGGAAVLISNMALNVFLFVKARSTRRMDELQAAGERVSARVDEHERQVRGDLRIHALQNTEIDKRLSVLETTVRHMPTHNDLTRIERELRDLSNGVAAMNERSESTLEMVRSIQSHLMEAN